MTFIGFGGERVDGFGNGGRGRWGQMGRWGVGEFKIQNYQFKNQELGTQNFEF
jgi:hypothetical protein